MANEECVCPVEHSITKLGHCATCPHFSGYWKSECVVETKCQHDFEWATYSDDNKSMGVCHCGVDAMSYHMMVGP